MRGTHMSSDMSREDLDDLALADKDDTLSDMIKTGFVVAALAGLIVAIATGVAIYNQWI